jgi:hypothetical protein
MRLLTRSLTLGALALGVFIPNNLRSAATLSGSTHCPASGTQRVLANPAPAFSYTVQSPVTNLGTINLGGTNISTSTGIQLQPAGSDHESASALVYNLSTVFFVCSNSADILSWKYEQ